MKKYPSHVVGKYAILILNGNEETLLHDSNVLGLLYHYALKDSLQLNVVKVSQGGS